MNTPIKNKNSAIHPQNGSVIMWVLIAVGLMAALSYAFMGSSRNSTSMITNTQAEAYASEIIAYGNEVKSAVKRLQLRGCDDTEISFENNVSSRGYPNTHSPTDNSCHIFNISGGSLNWLSDQNLLEPYANNVGWDNWYYDGRTAYQGIGNDCADSSCSELSLTSWGLNEKVCLKINKSLNIDEVAGEPPTDNISGDPAFDGTYSYSASHIIGDTTPELLAKSAACIIDDSCTPGPSSRCYVYYQILITR